MNKGRLLPGFRAFAALGILAGTTLGAAAQVASPSTPSATETPLPSGPVAAPAAAQTVTPPAATPGAAAADAIGSQPFLPAEARVPQNEIDAFVIAPDGALLLSSAGWVRQSRIVRLAGSDLRAVNTLVEYAKTAPSGIVSDIAAGLERASREAERAGHAAYGQQIQTLVASANSTPLSNAFAFAERSGGNIPATAAIGGAAAGGGISNGSLTGGNDGAAGGTGQGGGDDTVATGLGSYPIYGSRSSFGEDDSSGGGTDRFFIISADVSPAD